MIILKDVIVPSFQYLLEALISATHIIYNNASSLCRFGRNLPVGDAARSRNAGSC